PAAGTVGAVGRPGVSAAVGEGRPVRVDPDRSGHGGVRLREYQKEGGNRQQQGDRGGGTLRRNSMSNEGLRMIWAGLKGGNGAEGGRRGRCRRRRWPAGCGRRGTWPRVGERDMPTLLDASARVIEL